MEEQLAALAKSIVIVIRILCVALVIIGVGYILVDSNFAKGTIQIVLGVFVFYMVKSLKNILNELE